MATTWNRLLAEIRAELPEGDDALRIVEQLSDYSRGELVVHGDELVTDKIVARSTDMVARRQKGEPLQYVLGSWGFRNLDLLVDPRVLIPRPETETVVSVALERIKEVSNPKVVDLGTGSGAIALSIAQEHETAEVIAIDQSEDALAVARANLAGLGSPSSRVRLVAGSWFAPLPDELRGQIDLVVSNPPYIADSEELPSEVKDWEPSGALFAGESGLECYRTIVVELADWLAPDGAAVFEIAPHQADELVVLGTQFDFEAALFSDLSRQPRVLMLARSA